MQIISRAGWGARPPKTAPITVAPGSRSMFIVHYSSGPDDQTVAAIQRWCMDGRGFNDIDYNFLVGLDGTIYEGRGWNVIGAHTAGYNTAGIGVCVISKGPITDEAKLSVRWLYGEACNRSKKVLTVHVHRDFAVTTCPGDEIQKWAKSGALTPFTEDITNKIPKARRVLKVENPRMTGTDVRTVQRIVGAKIDGEYGTITEAHVRLWQAHHQLAADGIVGPKTWARLQASA